VGIGRAVRTRLGRFEEPVSDRYRSFFVDLDDCARILAEHLSARSILEVGCGDGQLASALVARFPQARYVGIDIAPDVGRLYHGDPERASFASVDSRTFLDGTSERFDLVLVVDVLHHVPHAMREDVLDDVRALTVDGGHYAVKDWIRSRSLAHAAAWASDRLLTGDRVAYFEEDELRALARRHPGDELTIQARVRPRCNNLLLVHRRGSGDRP
jgi:2-polyprenyl-6-hydroxyphenyl methylase/3-demethylubiquinone-9 3-methyltransferase